ncbi:MAG: hypothetical protein EB127_26970 [Alphaproteobacteria bacterium]|nr:hypothetical protein [Alphaproteobacteria bacterium]
MSLHEKTIKWKPSSPKQKIIQIYIKGIEYALVSEDNAQCHEFVWCKDFLHDVIYSCVNKKPFEIYHFKYNPYFDPNPCLDRIRLLIANPKDKEFKHKISDCVDFLNQVEAKLKIKKTVCRSCKLPPCGYEDVFLLEGSKRWISAPPMISLYSLLIRMGFLHTRPDDFSYTIQKIKLGALKPYQKFDKRWLLEAQSALDVIFKLGDKRIFSTNIQKNYPKNLSIDIVHNRLGIMGFSNDIVSKSRNGSVLVPHWHNYK